MFNDQILGKRLAKLHEGTNDSQEDTVKSIAQRTGVSIHQTTFSSYLRGTKSPTLPVLSALADYYGVSVDYLLGRTDDERPAATISKRLDQVSMPEKIEHASKMLAELPDRQQASLIAQIEAAHAEATERKQNREALDRLAEFLNVDSDRLYQIIRSGVAASDAGGILQSASELVRG